MNNIILNFLVKNFLKTIFIVVLIFYCFGLILTLFEEIEFFKNTDINFLTPLLLTNLQVPSIIIQILPFIIFISSMWFMARIRNNKDLLTLKIFGYSNFKIFFILAFTSFVLGWLILFIVNPITSTFSIYYEKSKSQFSKDIDHLITFNKNGLWIKETVDSKQRIISAKKPNNFNLIDVTIFHLDVDSNLIEKIYSKKVDIKNNLWELNETSIFRPVNGILVEEKFNNFEIKSKYNYEKINNLYKNFNTMSFFNITTNYNGLIEKGYSKSFLDQNLHSMLSLPFFLFIMTAIASIFSLSTLKKTENFKLIIVGLITSVSTFYINDLSLALGKIERIPLIISIWVPIVFLSLFAFIGILQINEK